MKMMIRLLRSTAAAALLVLVAGGALAAGTAKHRGAQAPGWTTHRPVSRPAWVTSPQPGLTVLHRQFLDDINARTAGDALRYVPGVIVR
jgi:outer membrane receptor protein involved in Fe transport